MNDFTGTAKLGRPIDLGAEPPFRLGALRIDPPARQVVSGGQSRTIEPRVMQVLVALAQAQGRVVSREQLIARCWSGRVVGDDAVHSCLAKVRALARLGGDAAYEIETIPRVGYRLDTPEAAKSAPDMAPPATSGQAPRWVLPRALAWAAGAVLIIAVAALIVYVERSPPAHWVVVESHQPFVSTPIIERYPALSPDGTMLAYSAGPTIESRHIFLRFIRGGEPIQLTHDALDAASPAWSPDGRGIAYVLFQDAHPCRIMEIPVPAGVSRQLGQCRFTPRSSLAWNRSGDAIYYNDSSTVSGPPRIWKLAVANGRISPVTSPPETAVADDSSSVSPDGRALLYRREIGGERVQIRMHSLVDGADRLVAGFDDGDDGTAWSPDGRTIFISRWKNDQTSIWAYPQGGGEPEAITAGSGYIGRMSTAANGLLADEISEAFPGRLLSMSLRSPDAPVVLDNSGLSVWSLDYAGDGTLVVLGHRSNVAAIWIAEPGARLHELVPLSKPHNGPIRWSPDGSRFAYVQQVADGYDIPVLSRTGAPVLQLHYFAKESGMLEWTADGRSILTSRQEAKGWRIWRTDLANPQRSFPISDYGWKYPRVRGSTLFAVRDGTPGVWRIGRSPRRIASGPSVQFAETYTVAGDRIIYYDDSDPAHPTLSAQNIDGGPKTTLVATPFGPADSDFAVEPKSGAIVYPDWGGNDTDIGLIRLELR
ncbi:MAG TPA: winged helix-turn-helix domain-containing protein [Rhizomicrobium sp.]|jgi:Tol biopolymer transport system component/DNA-binding winged helix-turn-helix (wHTH) protein